MQSSTVQSILNTNPENSWTDKALVANVLNGNTQSFATIVRNTEGLVAKIVFQMISNSEDRKDIAQDVYLKAFKNLQGFRFQSKLSTWIGQIAYNTCLNYLDKKKLVLAGNLPDEGDEDESFLDKWATQESIVRSDEVLNRSVFKERAAILQSAIASLPPIYKTLVLLFHQEELSYDEIGHITNLPAGTVKSYLFRARKSLKIHLLSKYQKEEI